MPRHQTHPALFLLLIAAVFALVGCKKEGQTGNAPVLYRLSAPSVYLYTDSDLKNNSYWVEPGSVVPACGRSGKGYELCPSGSPKPLFVRADQAEQIGSTFWWNVAYLRLDGDGAGITLKPSSDDPNLFNFKPAVWFEGQAEDQVDVWITPARCAPLMTFVSSADSAKYSISCHQEDSARSRLSIRWERILGITSQWPVPQRLDLKFKRTLSNPPVVVLDPGHGFSEPGMQWGDRFEKDMALDAAVFIKSKLEASGARVLLTREAEAQPPPEGALSLSQRTGFAAQQGADLFVSLHFDNWPNSLALPSRPSGLTCYYQHWFSASFAGGLCRQIGQRGWKTSWVVRRELGVLGSYRFPSMLLEIANLASPEDVAVVANRARFEEYMSALAAGIGDLLK